ncbi:MAG: NeuD/PglB/VioB family sugar acetyltransferase [Coriobacteriia bacterium]|nr:NeuD/PglB/VioB family sugar acetyltransferase [Coriobacteriia bacterium]
MRLLVVGAGGHAKVVVDAAMAAGHTILGIVGSPGDPPEVLGHPVRQGTGVIDIDGFIVAIGDNRTRERIFNEYCAAGLLPASVVHPSAVIGRDVEIADGAFVAPGVIINTGARIGANAILNTGCRIDHDVVIGAHAHVAPGATLCGASRLGTGSLLGVGASVVPGAVIGAGAIVGAGAAVTGDLPDGMVCVGVPARPTHRVEG